MRPWDARTKLIVLLGISCAMSIALVGVRVYHTDSLRFTWMIWNLFLAFIPFAISSLILPRPTLHSRWIFLPTLALWLLFFPNAPYVITDLIHLRPDSGIPLWYDLLLLMSFAWNSLLLGLVSLSDMQTIVQRKFSALAGWVFVVTTLGLSGFGIYLGRFSRWNSWDLFTNPQALFSDIAEQVLNPLENLSTYTFTFGFAAFLLLAYLIFKQLGMVERKALE